MRRRAAEGGARAAAAAVLGGVGDRRQVGAGQHAEARAADGGGVELRCLVESVAVEALIVPRQPRKPRVPLARSAQLDDKGGRRAQERAREVETYED